jgi:hypothetical protein
VDAKWKKGVAPPNANRSCAAPSKDPGTYGSWCYCRDSHDETWGYCRPSQSMPEQLNLQLSTADSVVVSFVTFESASFVTSSPPSCTLTDASGARTVHTGRTVVHQTPQKDRTLFMHFVALHELAPRANYSYSCSSDGSSPSPPLSFRAPYADGPTRLAMFGDMGVCALIGARTRGRAKHTCAPQPHAPQPHAPPHTSRHGAAPRARAQTPGTTWATWTPTARRGRSTLSSTSAIMRTTKVTMTSAAATAT